MLHPSITTSVDNSFINQVNANRTVTTAIIAPCTNVLVVGQKYELTSLSAAEALLGGDITKGNIALKLIDILFKEQSANVIKYIYPGSNVDSGTANDLDEAGGLAVGAVTFELTSATGFVIGDLIAIGAGATYEIRRILTLVSTTVGVNPLDFAHVDAEAVVKITEVLDSAYVTSRATLITEAFDSYLEDRTDATNTALVSTFLGTRVDDELFSRAVFGVAYGTSPATAKTDAQAIDDQYIRVVYNVYKDEDDGVIYEGSVNAARHLAVFNRQLSKQRLDNNVVISTVYLPLNNVSETIGPDINTALTLTVVNDLIDNNVSAGFQKTIAGVSAVRIIKDVTTYNTDDLSQPSTTYTNLVDTEANIKIRNDIPDVIERTIATRNDVGNTLTTKEEDLKDLENIVLNKINTYDFLETTGVNGVKPTVIVESPIPNEAQVTIVYKVVESLDIIEIVLAKQIR